MSEGLSPLSGEPDANGDDCVACGRCCHHAPNTVALSEDDEARMGASRLDLFTILHDRPPWFRFMRNAGARCAGLDASIPDAYPCAVYDGRPEGCRVVEPGSPCCMEARSLGHLGKSVLFKRADRG